MKTTFANEFHERHTRYSAVLAANMSVSYSDPHWVCIHSDSDTSFKSEMVVTFKLLCLCLDGELYEVLAGGVLLPLVVLPAHSILHLLTYTGNNFPLFLKCCLVLWIRIRAAFGPPGSGSGSFYHQAKKIRNTSISTILWLFIFDVNLRDPWYFDADPRNRTSDLWIRIWLLSSVTLKDAKEIFIHFFSL